MNPIFLMTQGLLLTSVECGCVGGWDRIAGTEVKLVIRTAARMTKNSFEVAALYPNVQLEC
jgi:hypothetical protein